MDKAGNLFGTTYLGSGSRFNAPGTVFELIPNATATAWTENVLYSFCAAAKCADGGAFGRADQGRGRQFSTARPNPAVRTNTSVTAGRCSN
jgi:hypothetical protein